MIKFLNVLVALTCWYTTLFAIGMVGLNQDNYAPNNNNIVKTDISCQGEKQWKQ